MSQKHFKPDIENQNVDDIVSEILGGLPEIQYSEVNLPSRGTDIYGLDHPILHIRPMTFADEKAIISAKGTKVVNTLLSRCIEEDINPRNLLLSDKLFIMLNLRSISVGNTYDFEIKCNNCEAKAVTEVDIINSFPVNVAAEPTTSKKTITPPDLGKEVVVRRATSGDLEDISDRILDEIWRFVISIDGHTNAKVRAQVLNNMSRRDIHTILNEITLPKLGIDQKFIYKCSKCQHEEVRELQLTQDFFTMK